MTMCSIYKFDIGGTRVDDFAKKNLQSDEIKNPKLLNGYSVVECSLKKELLKPNELSFTLRHIKPGNKDIDIIRALVGETVNCQVVTMDREVKIDSQIDFVGTIQKVFIKGATIDCVAYSEDCQLQGAAKCRCFTNKTLANIVKTIASDIETRVDIHPDVAKLVFPFIVQYNESDYDFLVRLAKRFGAFFYYHDIDAKSIVKKFLVFGKLPSNTVKAIDSPNAKAISYELETGDPNYRFVAYHGEKDTSISSMGYGFDHSAASNKITNEVVLGSTSYENKDPKYYIDYPYGLSKDPQKDGLELQNSICLSVDMYQMVTCKFISYRFDLQVGDVVTIDDNGKLVVTSVHLSWDCNGFPQNEVTAMRLPNDTVNLDDIYAPYIDLNAYPKSSAQRAIVVNNVDPLKMGRVQVRFVWQQDPNEDVEEYPWIRIAQPYIGGNKEKSQGCYILPEIDDEVIVGFEHENMEKPFVIGSLYHDSDEDDQKRMPEESWVETDQANKKNEVKAFRTKKGHTIEFHDVDGDDKCGFIRIYGNEKKDGPNYDIILSTDPIKDKDYTIESASMCDEGKDDFKIDKLRVLVRSNGGDIMLDAGDGDIVMNAMNIRLHTQQDLTAYIGGKEVITVEDTHFLETKDSGLHVKKNREVLIDEKDDYSSKNLVIAVSEDSKFSAKSLTLKTDQKTEIKAQSINTNTKQNTEIVAQTFKASAREEINIFGSNKVTITSNKDVGVLGMSKATLQGTETNVTGLSKINLKAPSGTRVGSWTDM